MLRTKVNRNWLFFVILTVLLDLGCQRGQLEGQEQEGPDEGETTASVFEAGASPVQLLDTGAGEGPAWHPQLGLLFSGGGRIGQYTTDGQAAVYREARSNGLLFDHQGRLLSCERRTNKGVSRTERDGTITMLTDQYEGKTYNNSNDLTIDAQGRVYFSDPRYGSREGMEILDAVGRPIEGVYRIDPDGEVTRVITHEVDRPNGVLVSLDGSVL